MERDMEMPVKRTEARLVDRGETMARTRASKLSRWCRAVVCECAEAAMEVSDDAVAAAMNESENQLRHDLDAAGLLEQVSVLHGSPRLPPSSFTQLP